MRGAGPASVSGNLPTSSSSPLAGEAPADIDPALLEVYVHHGDYEEPDLQRESASTALEQLRRRAARALRWHEQRAPAHRRGCRFGLDGHPGRELFDREYVVVRVRHVGNLGTRFGPAASRPLDPLYTNRFEAAGSDVVYRPARSPRNHQQVLESAIVVGPPNEEIHTDEYGRVKVQFHWDREGQNDERSSCWIRLAQGWAGAGYGVRFVHASEWRCSSASSGATRTAPVVAGDVSTT